MVEFFSSDVVHLARKESTPSKWLGESLDREFKLSIATSLYCKDLRKSVVKLEREKLHYSECSVYKRQIHNYIGKHRNPK